jgi:hypothetical protein
MSRFFMVVLGLSALTGCAYGPPPTAADQAVAAACTSAAGDTYKAQNFAQYSRTSQNGLIYSATPNHVFDAEQMGAMHQYDSQISNCERNGSTSAALPGPPPVTPHIITTP